PALSPFPTRRSSDLMLSMFALACAASFALYHLLRRTTSFALEGRLLAWALLNSLLFCPDQYVNFLWGIQLEPLIPGTLLLFAMLDRKSTRLNSSHQI